MQDSFKELGADAHLRTLSDELAEMMGLSEIDAIASALEDRLSRVKGPASHEERIIKALASLRASPHSYRDTSRREQNVPNDADGAVTLDAAALLMIHRREDGWEELVRRAMASGNARVPATALAEAGMAIVAKGNYVEVLGLDEIVRTLSLTVVPFTGADWHAAVTEYEQRRRRNPPPVLSLGDCLTAVVAARTGTRVLSGTPPAISR